MFEPKATAPHLDSTRPEVVGGRQTGAFDPMQKSWRRCARLPLFFWRKILIGQWRCDGTLNANKRLVGPRVAAIAATGKLVEGDRKFGAALCSNRLFKLFYPWIDDCLFHLSDRNALKGWKQPCGVL
jgi:hypothetical protein